MNALIYGLNSDFKLSMKKQQILSIVLMISNHMWKASRNFVNTAFEFATHIINGLPLEDYDMMMETAREVAKLDVQGIKIHLLHLLKGTPMVKQYEKGQLEFLKTEEYINLVADQLEILPPEMIVHRITGDGPIELMIGPMWSVTKWEVLNGIDKELERRDSWQGKYANEEKQK